ncbi:hypothetical protein [Gordonia sp. (in: high G+C Gram-positive bacteria)]|uniref:hypothetical protein n=1 Tax=Gordonia sp. (in: high G+C Gram-positive bacteria) TaxID=84139 RepID=UPI0039E711AC
MSDDVQVFPGDPDEWRSVDALPGAGTGLDPTGENPGTVDENPGTLGENPGTLGGEEGEKRRRRTTWILSGLAVVLGTALVAGLMAVQRARSDPDATPAGVATAYFQALADGDAQRALSYSSSTPVTTEFLTDEILRRQTAKTPISEIRVVRESGGTTTSTVRVAVRFGDNDSEVTLRLTRADGSWKLRHSAVEVRGLPGDNAGRVLRLFGKPVTVGTIALFPGYVEFATPNPNFAVSSNEFVKPDWLLPGGVFAGQLRVRVTASPAGADAAEKAIRAAFDRCLQSTDPTPEDCPNRVRQTGAVPGSARWGKVEIPSLSRSYFNRRRGALLFSLGIIEFPVSVSTPAGPTTDVVKRYVVAEVDLFTNPPTVTF